jgi:hypothetical protein
MSKTQARKYLDELLKESEWFELCYIDRKYWQRFRA